MARLVPDATSMIGTGSDCQKCPRARSTNMVACPASTSIRKVSVRISSGFRCSPYQAQARMPTQ